jgi:hypothetical protein
MKTGEYVGKHVTISSATRIREQGVAQLPAKHKCIALYRRSGLESPGQDLAFRLPLSPSRSKKRKEFFFFSTLTRSSFKRCQE